MFLTEDKAHSGSGDTLGGRIVHAREAQDLTTSQLARRMGIKTETLQEWETDRAEPRSNRLLTLAGMLNVSPTWLLTGAGESPVDALTETEMMQIRESVERMRAQVLAVADELEQLRKRLDSYESYRS
jgi:transcriptional regulator with XRE-family HTH domain